MDRKARKVDGGGRSRRELLTGAAAGAVGVITAQGILGPKPASAGGDGDVVLGASNSETTATLIFNTSAGDTALYAQAAGNGQGLYGVSNSGDGIYGQSSSGNGVDGLSNGAAAAGLFGKNTGGGNGVWGTTNSTSGASAVGGDNTGTGNGVYGHTTSSTASGVQGVNQGSGPGVLGGAVGTTGDGVEGRTDSASNSAVYAHNESTSAGGKGVFGISRHGTGVEGDGPQVGVLGNNTGTGNGVEGHTTSAAASGVYGQNNGTGFGVAGRALGGTGVLGDSANGVGVAASSANATALSVTGKAKFNRSGVVSITNPAMSATVTVPGGLSTASLVLALVQNAVAGIWVVRAVPNTSTGKATITLNKTPASGSAKVAWFVVN